MDAIKTARELGKAIQADDRYKAYQAAKEANDSDADLQDKIGEFNLLRQQIMAEAQKPENERDTEKINSLNQKAQGVYALVMSNDNMRAFTERKNDMDAMIKDISSIISLCCDGEDPDTCEYRQPESGCGSGGGCGGCNGCG